MQIMSCDAAFTSNKTLNNGANFFRELATTSFEPSTHTDFLKAINIMQQLPPLIESLPNLNLSRTLGERLVELMLSFPDRASHALQTGTTIEASSEIKHIATNTGMLIRNICNYLTKVAQLHRDDKLLPSATGSDAIRPVEVGFVRVLVEFLDDIFGAVAKQAKVLKAKNADLFTQLQLTYTKLATALVTGGTPGGNPAPQELGHIRTLGGPNCHTLKDLSTGWPIPGPTVENDHYYSPAVATAA